MRVKLTFQKHGYHHPNRYSMIMGVYDSYGDIVAREVRDVEIQALEDGEHFNFPNLKLVGIDT